MANPSKKAGTAFETAVRNYLDLRAGVTVWREALHGSADEGDLQAIVRSHKVAIECKRVERVTPALLAKYRLQAVVEADNARADACCLVLWRKGKGYRYDLSPAGQRAKSFGENVAEMRVRDMLALGGAVGDVAMSDELADAWVSMPLSTLADIVREEG